MALGLEDAALVPAPVLGEGSADGLSPEQAPGITRCEVTGVELNRTEVDLRGLLEVLGKHLYSTPAVAIRELVQNAHDSCVRRRLAGDSAFEPNVAVFVDPGHRAVVVEDNGAGLTRDEIRKYLATVGAGATGEARRRDVDASAELIGQFGVGFLTAFFVSDRVEVETTPMSAPDEGWRFSSRGGERYSLAPMAARPVGTRVVLHLTEEARPLADAVEKGDLLEDFFALLPTPVFADASRSRRVNALTPPWRLEEVGDVRRRRLEMEVAERFEPLFRPLCCVRVPLSEEDGTQGLLWIQDGSSYATSDHRHVSVFVRGMLVTHDARELLPGWAGFVGAVLESARLRPTASRESLQEDLLFRKLALRLREVLIEGLRDIARDEPEVWRAVTKRHDQALLGAAVAEPRLFELLGDELRVPTTEGDLAIPTVALRSRPAGARLEGPAPGTMRARIHVSLAEDGGPEEVLHRALGVPVILGHRYAALPFADRWCKKHGATLVRLGTAEGDRLAFPAVDLDPAGVAVLNEILGREGVEVMATRFEPSALPFLLVPDREAELKARLESDEADRRIAAAALRLARLHVEGKQGAIRARLYVNLACPIIEGALFADPRRRAAAGAFLRGLAGVLSRGEGGMGLVEALESVGEGFARLLQDPGEPG